MQTPPFRAAPLPSAIAWNAQPAIAPGAAGIADAAAASGQRLRLGEMDPHLHCSVIGTCLSTIELRKLMARFIDVGGLDDLEVHHEAVRLTAHDPALARALSKVLDRRHEASVQRFARAGDDAALAGLWQQSLKAGEVPGAYWAVLTHRRSTPALRQQVFGDVHMLSHLVGAANRADIRRLVALEQENRALHERAEGQQQRLTELAGERERCHAERDELRARVVELERAARSVADRADSASGGPSAPQAMAHAVAVQTERRAAAEARADALHQDLSRLQQELEHLRTHAGELGRELAAAEAELHGRSVAPDAAAPSALHDGLADRRIVYVGGRPSSGAAIRDLVLRHGGEYRRHDGGLEDRKGLLAAALAGADLVVFPVDCVDHDSALALKRICLRQGTPFLALRSASVASFAAAITAMRGAPPPRGPSCGGPCLRHG